MDADLAPGKTYYVKSYARAASRDWVVWSTVGGLAPLTRESKKWDRIERRIRSMRCRELIPDVVLDYEKEDPLGVARYRVEPPGHDAESLRREDGK